MVLGKICRVSRRVPRNASYKKSRTKKAHRMSVLDEIMIDMSIVLGSAEVPIRQMLKMSRGAMIPLDCGQDDPSLVYVNGELVARGRILVDGDQMSLEVSELVKKSRN
jgi:flagellar motor switch protein FliN/FliY